MTSNNDAKPPVHGKWATILLAAGLSRRMGEQNKLLIPIDGVPLIRRMAETYLSAEADLHVVLGHEAELVRAALNGLPLTFVENPDFADGGQMSSVRAGIESLRDRLADYDAVLVALADQLALTSNDIRELCKAFTDHGGNFALIPYWGECRGNPVIFPPRLIAEILTERPETSPRQYLDRKPHLAMRYDAPNDHFVIDIDTPEDLRRYLGTKA